MNPLFRISSIVVVSLSLLAPAAFAYDDYGFYLMDVENSYAESNTGRAQIQSSGRRAMRPARVCCTPRTVASYPVVLSPAAPVIKSRPAPSIDGSTVRVRGATTKRLDLRKGGEVVGSIPAGSEVQVVEVRHPWVGVLTQASKPELQGWVPVGDLQLISVKGRD
ncbi:MAG: hypothetical protein AAF989_04665 [Planctomycetota bacterium]